MTHDELDRLDALAAEASPGPWATTVVAEDDSNVCIKHEHFDVYRVVHATQYGEANTGEFWPSVGLLEVNVGCYLGEAPDAAFIAASRDAVPALVAEVKRLRALAREAYEEGQRTPHDELGAWYESDARKALDGAA